MTRKAFGLAGLAGLSAALLAAPAFAHHAFAMFDQSKTVYMTGTVKQFELVNPHGWLHVNIVNDKGETSTWSFEGGSVAQLVSLGWKDSVKAGRQGRGRLSSDEGRFARRPAHEHEARERAEAVLQPRLRRRNGRYRSGRLPELRSLHPRANGARWKASLPFPQRGRCQRGG